MDDLNSLSDFNSDGSESDEDDENDNDKGNKVKDAREKELDLALIRASSKAALGSLSSLVNFDLPVTSIYLSLRFTI